MTATELLALQFCLVPWCEQRKDETHPHFCTYHAEQERLHQQEISSIEDPTEPFALSVRFQVLKRDLYRCQLCGVAAQDGPHVRLEVDHIIPRSKGGSDDIENKHTLCFACNRGKGTREL
jgi:predicted restriction endonuclease